MGISQSSSEQHRVAKDLRVPKRVIKAMYQQLKSKYGDRWLPLHHFSYESPEFRRIVERAVDTDQDQKLHLLEYIRFIHLLSSRDVDDRLRELFRVFDSDQNGHISRAEVRDIFAAADDMRGRARNEQRAEEFFNKVDSDGDNQVTCGEFVFHARNDSSVMNDLEEIRWIILGWCS